MILANRKKFPILDQKINDQNFVYFDNAATTQKPQEVIDTLFKIYSQQNSSPHSQHHLSQEITTGIEKSRNNIATYLGVENSQEIVFTSGATDSINLVAASYGELLDEGDEVIITDIEHHANLVPWQILRDRKGITLKIWKAEADGKLDLKKLEKLISNKTKLLAVTHISNVLGIINPIRKIVNLAHQRNVLVLVDGTQAAQHLKINLQEINPDFYVFSAHKMFGPNGVGILYAKLEHLKKMSPYRTGGDMIENVNLGKTTFRDVPYKFEAGTQDYPGIITFGKTIDFLQKIHTENDVFRHEKELKDYLIKQVQRVEGIKILGSTENRIPLVSFYFENINSFDLAAFLDLRGIAIRAGRHCAEPLHQKFGIYSSLRASLSFYNIKEEIDFFVEELYRLKKKFV